MGSIEIDVNELKKDYKLIKIMNMLSKLYFKYFNKKIFKFKIIK